jgi:hypothetical protein
MRVCVCVCESVLLCVSVQMGVMQIVDPPASSLKEISSARLCENPPPPHELDVILAPCRGAVCVCVSVVTAVIVEGEERWLCGG